MKKNWLYIVGGVVIVLILAAIIALIIAVNGKTEPFKIDGAWKVTSNAGAVTTDEYMVFTEDKVTLYQNGASAQYSYEWDNNHNSIVVAEINKSFYLEKKTDNVIGLVDGGNIRDLIRVASYPVSTEKPVITGEWTVLIHSNGAPKEGEKVIFTDTIMKQVTKEGSAELTYEWLTNNKIFIERINDTFEIYKLNDTTLLLVQTSTNGIWELKLK